MKIKENKIITDFLNLLYKESTTYNIYTYLVGGAVRDLLLFSKLDQDLDFVFIGDVLGFAKTFANKHNLPIKTHPDFLTANIKYNNLSIDFITARKEFYISPGGLPKVSIGSIDHDLQRRDFTVNSFCILLSDLIELLGKEFSIKDLEKKIYDPLLGLKDLRKKKIRILHSNSFRDDPTRIFRAIVYKNKIQGSYTWETKKQLKKAIGDNYFRHISSYRIHKEIKKILRYSDFDLILKELNELNIFIKIGYFARHKKAKFKKALKLFKYIDVDVNQRIDLVEMVFLYLSNDIDSLGKRFSYNNKKVTRVKEYLFDTDKITEYNLKSFLSYVENAD